MHQYLHFSPSYLTEAGDFQTPHFQYHWVSHLAFKHLVYFYPTWPLFYFDSIDFYSFTNFQISQSLGSNGQEECFCGCSLWCRTKKKFSLSFVAVIIVSLLSELAQTVFLHPS